MDSVDRLSRRVDRHGGVRFEKKESQLDGSGVGLSRRLCTRLFERPIHGRTPGILPHIVETDEMESKAKSVRERRILER